MRGYSDSAHTRRVIISAEIEFVNGFPQLDTFTMAIRWLLMRGGGQHPEIPNLRVTFEHHSLET